MQGDGVGLTLNDHDAVNIAAEVHRPLIELARGDSDEPWHG